MECQTLSTFSEGHNKSKGNLSFQFVICRRRKQRLSMTNDSVVWWHSLVLDFVNFFLFDHNLIHLYLYILHFYFLEQSLLIRTISNRIHLLAKAIPNQSILSFCILFGRFYVIHIRQALQSRLFFTISFLFSLFNIFSGICLIKWIKSKK